MMFNESSLSLNHKVNSNYKLNFLFKSRSFIYDNDELLIKQQQLDIGHFSTFAISLKSSISFGLMFRNRDWFEDSENEFRTTIKFNTKKIKDHLRFGHRFISEQRFFESSTSYRFRYRLAFDIPLEGEKLNIGEIYFVSATEALWSVNKKNKPILDNRWSAQIGWLQSKNTKLQFGLEYRLGELNVKTNSSLFLLTSAIFNL